MCNLVDIVARILQLNLPYQNDIFTAKECQHEIKQYFAMFNGGYVFTYCSKLDCVFRKS
jgi:hypothetical protein